MFLATCMLLTAFNNFGQCCGDCHTYICCLNFWDAAWWFLSLRVFKLLSSSLLLFPLHFGLLQVFVEVGNLHGTSTFIESTGVACSDSVSHNRVQVLSIPVLITRLQSGLNLQPPDDCLLRSLWNQRL